MYSAFRKDKLGTHCFPLISLTILHIMPTCNIHSLYTSNTALLVDARHHQMSGSQGYLGLSFESDSLHYKLGAWSHPSQGS